MTASDEADNPVDDIETTMRTLIERDLASYLHENATFLCERLYAYNARPENLHLLATCYYRSNQYNKAYKVLQKGMVLPSPYVNNSSVNNAFNAEALPQPAALNKGVDASNRYLFAMCCYELGHLREAEAALLLGTDIRTTGPSSASEQILTDCPVPNGSAGLYLLGKICQKDNRREYAVEYFSLSLKLNPFLWDAYQQLTNIGCELPPTCFFGVDPNGNANTATSSAADADQMDTKDENVLKPSALGSVDINSNIRNATIKRASPVECPIPIPTKVKEISSLECLPKFKYLNSGTKLLNSEKQQFIVPPFQLTPMATKKWATPTPESTSTNNMRFEFEQNQNQTDANAAISDPNNEEYISSIIGGLEVLSLLRVFGEALLLLSQYCCKESITKFQALPPAQYNTGWVLHRIGKAYFEMADYRNAKDTFESMRQVAPERLHGLEIYSTNLWHLKNEVEICYLAQEAVSMDRRSPEAWCVVGNCFSLQKEHDVAIKFFNRALQLDPSFTYAYTLSGHEYVSNEDFEKAVACYRHAIRTDSRHYNAWYGLGTIYYRQEKYELAEYHFRRALAINPRSSVLYCYLGMVLHASQKCEEALRMLEHATALEPHNPQARFQRAGVLRTMEQYDAALDELEMVRNFVPREASVHFLMGKICKQLGRRDDAMLHFTTALDLDPKEYNTIKSSIDKLDSNDMDDVDDL